MALVALLCVGLSGAESPSKAPRFATGRLVDLERANWPVELLPAIEALERRAPGERVFNSLHLGGFLVYHARDWKHFIDDRCELFGGDFLREYVLAERSEPERVDAWRERYGFDLALVLSNGPFDEYLSRSPSWVVVQPGRTATLYRHVSRVDLIYSPHDSGGD